MTAPAYSVRIRRPPLPFTAPRLELLRAVLEAKRAEHPEIAGVPTLTQLRRVAERDEMYISVRDDLSAGVQRVLLAAELARCWLHLCDARLQTALRLDDRTLRAVCEEEADRFAGELLEIPFEIVEAVTRYHEGLAARASLRND